MDDIKKTPENAEQTPADLPEVKAPQEAAAAPPEEVTVDTAGETPAPPSPEKEPVPTPTSLKNNDLWQNILRPVVALVIICSVASLLMGLTNGATAPIIAANTAAAAERARIALLPEADGFEQVDVPAELSTVTAIYRATNDVGWIVQAYGRGYGGQVPALVAFDENGDISGVTFSENSETVGLGQKVRDPAFYEQFAGQAAESLTLNDIDKIASATISSNAGISAVNAAIDAYHQVTGTGINPQPDTTQDAPAKEAA